MVKKIEKVDVLESLSVEQIKNIGTNRWFVRHLKLVIGLMFVGLALLAVVDWLWEPTPHAFNYVVLGVIVGAGLWLMWKMSQEGKKFWLSVKDQPRPIDLRK